MSRTSQPAWSANASYLERSRKPTSLPKWSQREQSGRNVTDTAQTASGNPRTFAEFPFSKAWQEILIHAQRLQGASNVGLYGQGDETWLRFAYMGASFDIQDGGHRLTLTVDDCDCPESVLLAVQSHFAALLSPHLRD
jgi:hypothetical protein